MQPSNSREKQRGAGSIQECFKLRTAVTSSSSTESSTDTEMGLVDVCTILCVNSDEEGRLIGSPINSGEGDKEQTLAFLHLAFICEL